MRKQTKLVAVLSAAALLAMGASMTSFAAGWEKDDAGVWHYYDKDDEMVTGEWRKDGSKWFYLDEDGDMLMDSWVDEEYYVGADGAMLVNQWAKTASEDGGVDDPDEEGDHWFYFGSKGKKISDGKKKINGKTYYFNEDGEMRDGWYSPDNGETVYYLGGEDEGGRAENQWLWLECPTDEDPEDGEWTVDEEGSKLCDDEGWYWFGTDGKMYKEAKKKTINGKYYFFNKYGQMLYEWINTKSTNAGSKNLENANDGVYAENERTSAREEAASSSVASGSTAEEGRAEFDNKIVGNMVYANQVEDGSRINGWREIEGSQDAGTDGSTDWYFFDDGEAKKANAQKGGKDHIKGATDDGNPVYRARIKVDSPKGGKAYFCFNELGQMQTGLQYIPGSNNGFYYFDSDGYPKTGKVTDVEEGDNDVYDYYFVTKNGGNGKGFTGEKDGYFYWNGKRLEAEDENAFYVVNGKMYLVNTKGKLQKTTKGKKYKVDAFDGAEVFIKTNDSYEVTSAAITVGDDGYWYVSSKEYEKDQIVDGEQQVAMRAIKDGMRLALVYDKLASVPSISVYDNVFAPGNPFIPSNGEFYDSKDDLDKEIKDYIESILSQESEEE